MYINLLWFGFKNVLYGLKKLPLEEAFISLTLPFSTLTKSKDRTVNEMTKTA